MSYLILKIIIGLLLLLAIVVAGIWVVNSRSMANDDAMSPIDDLTEFRQMREEGKIDEEEFRRLKRAISENTFGISEADNEDEQT